MNRCVRHLQKSDYFYRYCSETSACKSNRLLQAACVRKFAVYCLLFTAAFFTACKTDPDDLNSTTAATVATTAVSVSPAAYTLNKGASTTLTAARTPSNSTQTITWTSSNTAYVTVSGNGNGTTASVTAVKGTSSAQTIIITATSGGSSAACTITVPKISVSAVLSDSAATENTQKVFQYLTDVYGSKVISGQMENAWNNDCDMLDRVYSDTKKYPALMGFDFMNYTSMGYTAANKQTERAINFWNGKNYSGTTIASGKHGIVAFMWHWRAPDTASGTTGSFYTQSGNASDYTTYQIPYNTSTDSWETTSTDYTEMLADLNTIAAELAELQTAGVPVLWRPLHEASGNIGKYTGGTAWFWWGNGGNTDSGRAESYIALWKFMYTYFTQTKGLHNLIWVWNAQNAGWYPGDNYVDIISDDIYGTAQDYSSNISAYTEFQGYAEASSSKLVALSETGNIPAPSNIISDGAWWSYFMIWNDGDYSSTTSTVTTDTSSSNFWSGEYYNTVSHKTDVYDSSTVVTLNGLPDLTAYGD
jgi:mannan endo-1,4-beta-mannosidase